jgi:hypothetical protein
MLAVRNESEVVQMATATVVKDFVYNRFEEQILVREGTEILLDVTQNIAFIGEDHVRVYPGQVKVSVLS